MSCQIGAAVIANSLARREHTYKLHSAKILRGVLALGQVEGRSGCTFMLAAILQLSLRVKRCSDNN